MKIFDTHSHMYAKEFDSDLDECMAQALEDGVYLTALPNIDVESIERVQNLMRAYPDQTIGMMGLHPCSVKEDYKQQLATIKTELDTGRYHAVGETGIDLYWDKTYFDHQVDSFKTQIRWAKEKSLPIVIHARDSFQEIFDVLDTEYDNDLSGVFHCFTGNEAEAEKALSYDNFYLGLGGVLTFKNSGLDKVISRVDQRRLVLETDAPYLSPHPFRGKRNQTAYTKLVAQKLAEIFEVSVEELAEITTANAKKLFKLNGI
ncbi:TatD family hydrolase [Cryomorpha ignava]|uniref:TatD family hydrolase n=1 Tax=Cryomorpha ignava TaxID=101383 RepID=UPI001EF85E3F|nr:TatD family hydrolase [Cryomorpha ignava]